MTWKSSLGGGRMPFLEYIGVIIRQLFARFHIADRLNPDPAVLDDRITVGVARVFDEPRIVSIHCCVDDDVIIYREEISMMPVALVIGVSLVRPFRRQPLSGVLDQACSSWDWFRCECTQSLNR